MLRLLGLVLSVGIADSLNPTTIAPALYLASGPQPRRKVAEFTAAVFLVYFAGGAIIALGPGRLLISAFPHPHRHVRGIIEIVAGTALIVGALFLWHRRGSLVERDLPEVKVEGRSSAILGATITALELPTAFPYFAVIAALVGSDVGVARELFLLVVFNVCFVAPMLGILAVLQFAPGDAARVLGGTRRWLQERWPHVLSIVLLIAGVIVVILGATGLSSPRSRFGRFIRRIPRP